MLFTHLNHSILKTVIGIVAAVSVVSGCGASRPDTVTLIIEILSPNFTSSGFAIRLGDWQEEGVKSGRYEVPVPKEWVSGTEVSISMVEDFIVGQDIFTDESYDVWSDGKLIIDEVGWDKPLTLRIGEAVAYVDPGSWATVKVSPKSGRFSFISEARRASLNLGRELNEFQNDLNEAGRQGEGDWYYSIRCGLDFPWKLNKNGGYSFTYDAMELYFLKCSRNIETVYLSQVQTLAESVDSSEEYLKVYGKSRLLQSLEFLSEELEDLAYTYERESTYLNSSEYDKAKVFLESAYAKVAEAISSTENINVENQTQMSKDLGRLLGEWKKHCVKDGANCK